MKKRYRIGLILGMVLPVVLFGIGYGIGAHRLPEKKLPENVKAEKLTPAEGDAQKNSGYYLKDLNGYLAVYLQDGQTLYEYTDISVQELPEELQEEIISGKRIETTEELYGFLENYSS